MSRGGVVDGIADMGGTPGWGPTHPPERDEPVFAEPWQGRAFAVALLSQQVSGFNVDAFRHDRASEPFRLPGPGLLRSPAQRLRVDAHRQCDPCTWRGRRPRSQPARRTRQGTTDPPARHTRLAGYVRGHTGTVQRIQPSALLPDTHAHFTGENPQHVYTFDSHELWGAGADPFAVTIELFESYLEKIT
jgi:nitrile hydratase